MNTLRSSQFVLHGKRSSALDLIHPMYQQTASYGHFGRAPHEVKMDNGKKYTAFSWEKTITRSIRQSETD